MRIFLSLVFPIFALLFSGCSQRQSLLHQAGPIALVSQYHTQDIESDDRVAIKWSINDRSDSTRAVIGVDEQPVPVYIIEANREALRLQADSWEGLADLPVSYRYTSAIKIVPPSKRNKRPTVVLPIRYIREISLYEERRPTSPAAAFKLKNIGKGALGGFAVGASLSMMPTDLSNKEWRSEPNLFTDAEEALVVSTIATATGAIFYPVYKMFRPDGPVLAATYPIGPSNYQIAIKTQK